VPLDPHENSLPVPCILLPERIQEYPPWHALTDDQQERLRQWKPDGALQKILAEYRYDSLADLYHWELSVCIGTKVGGYCDYFQSPFPKEQTRAGRDLPYLLTVSAEEFGMNNHQRWRPIEDREAPPENDPRPEFETYYQEVVWQRRAFWPAQLFGDDGRIHFFVDREIDGWPVYEESDVD
jgi:hypothetical protein